MSKIFISGIDTDAGKSYCTAWYANRLTAEGQTVITQKFIQTGNVGRSEDIELPRALTVGHLLDEDREGLTAPVIFSYPASAQLAARIDGREIDLGVIDRASDELQRRFDTVLIEGAGGLMVPLTDDFFAIDYVASRRLPLILVVNAKLGSINHTILSLEAIKARGIQLAGVLYNTHFDNDAPIAADTHGFIARYLSRHFPDAFYLDVPSMQAPECDFR